MYPSVTSFVPRWLLWKFHAFNVLACYILPAILLYGAAWPDERATRLLFAAGGTFVALLCGISFARLIRSLAEETGRHSLERVKHRANDRRGDAEIDRAVGETDEHWR
jgi:type VI protein secretion system component VasK